MYVIRSKQNFVHLRFLETKEMEWSLLARDRQVNFLRFVRHHIVYSMRMHKKKIHFLNNCTVHRCVPIGHRDNDKL